MSRIGRKPVAVPANVKVAVADSTCSVEGPNGKLSYTFEPGITVDFQQESRQVVVQRRNDDRDQRALHGLTRSLINNMVTGVTQGYTKKLEIVGVGYQAQLKGNTLTLQVGYANTISKPVPEGLKVLTPDATHITVTGADKQLVGQFAAEVRAVRPPEPYKGKGIRYEGEKIIRKSGKAFGSK